MNAFVIEKRRAECLACPAPCDRYKDGQIDHADGCEECPSGRWFRRTCRASRTLPALPTLAGNFIQAAGVGILSMLAGDAAPTAAEMTRRLTICRGCEFYLAAQDRCAKCGCFISRKATWTGQSCPIGRWANEPAG